MSCAAGYTEIRALLALIGMFVIVGRRAYLMGKEDGAMSDVLTIVIVILVVLIVLAAGAAAWIVVRRRSLRQRFGPEYDRVVSEQDGRFAAERELRARERRHAELDLHPLSDESRAAYAGSWEEIQARFVDAPNEAVGAADELVTRLISERGYPTENFDEQIAQLSVEHARTLEHYRDAHEIHLRNERGEASTEQLRQALVHYRALFGDLLGQPEKFAPEPVQSERASAEPARSGSAEPGPVRSGSAEPEPARSESATVPQTRERSSDAHPERAS
jgi:hypothetical protein